MRKKKMNLKIQYQLLTAAELIAKEKETFICTALFNSKYMKTFDIWKNTEEAKMIDPYVGAWWGLSTMRCSAYSNKARGARLIGIAMMLTMPEEIINHECCKK